MLVVQPIGGLCNRLRAIDATVALATELTVRPMALWFLEDDLNAGFHGLFETTEDARIIDVHTHVGRRLLRHLIRQLFHPRFGSCFLTQQDIEPMIGSRTLVDLLSHCRHGYLRAHSGFWPTSRPMALFRPLPELQAVIDRFGTDQLVGVHVRRTDNALSIRHSPIESFMAAMQDEIDSDHDTRFFLATDDHEVEEAVQRRFPGRVVIHEKFSLARNDPRAIRDAVIDLYVLSNCRKLIGSYWSSFSDAASSMRGIECRIVNQAAGAADGNGACA